MYCMPVPENGPMNAMRVYVVLCGAMATEVHHIEFRSHGVCQIFNNLVCLCRDCHIKSTWQRCQENTGSVKRKEFKNTMAERRMMSKKIIDTDNFLICHKVHNAYTFIRC